MPTRNRTIGNWQLAIGNHVETGGQESFGDRRGAQRNCLREVSGRAWRDRSAQRSEAT